MKNNLFDETGLVKVRPPAGDKPRPKTRANARAEKQAREYEVCSHCTKATCRGSERCMKKHMKEDTQNGKTDQEG